MSYPILTTKFFIPPIRPGLLSRLHLIELLRESADSKLTLLSAAPGYGKTTLLSDWVAYNTYPSTWLSLDHNDNEPNRFIIYFISALQRVDKEIGQKALGILQSMHKPPYEVILTNLINDISEIEEHFTLILDDYHVITELEIHRLVAFLIENLPQSMHLVIATRSDPPFPLSRLRVRGQLCEIRQAELRFTREETTYYLNQIMGLNLESDQIKLLEKRTEGWVAGLQLAGLSMQDQVNHDNFLRRFGGNHRLVFDYLLEEVFANQTEDMRQFLRLTSILDQFNTFLCNAVLGREDADQFIRQLEIENLFLIPLDDQRNWYRYHHLFRDFLRTRLAKDDQRDLHRKAVGWLMANGFVLEAVEHALASEDIGIIMSVISPAAWIAINQAAFQTLMGWMDTLTEKVICDYAELAVFKGLVLSMLRSPEEARPYVQAAEEARITDAPRPTKGLYFYQKSLLALCDNQLDQCIQYANIALNELSDNQPVIRHLTMNVLGEVLDIKGDVKTAADFYQQAFDAGWRTGDIPGALVLFTNLILALNELGLRNEAEDACIRLADLVDAQSFQDLSIIDAIYLPWSLIKLEANQLDIAREYVLQALSILELVKFPSGIIWCQYVLAQIYLAEGKHELVHEISKKVQELAAQMRVGGIRVTWFTALSAQADLIQGNLSSALRWVEKTGLSPQDTPDRWSECIYFTYVRILLAQNNYDEAKVLLQTMGQSIRSAGRIRKLIELDILESQLLTAQHNIPEAVLLMVDAIELAAPQDYLRVFLNEGKNIISLLNQAYGAAPVFVNDLLLVIKDPDVSAIQIPGRYESLTEREQEVLNLVGKGFSNREIAESLYVSLGTVKKHLNNIFGKLDVKNRTQAFNRGKELGLFA